MSYTILFPNYTIGENPFTEVPNICQRYGTKITVIGGKTALSKVAADLEKAVEGSELEILDMLWYGGEATLEHVATLKNNPAVQNADMLFAVGGGRAIDTCKMLAHDLNMPFMTVPTIASTCAACTGVAVYYYPNGEFRDLYLSDVPANHIFIPTQVIAAAPDEYLWAGIGDTLAKHYESVFSSRNDELEHFNALGVNISTMSAEPLVKYGKQAMEDSKKDQTSAAMEQIILAIIVSTGLVSNLVINDYNSALAHSIYYGSTAVDAVAEKHLHGEIVAYGVLVLLMLDQQQTELERIFRFNKSIGLPTKLADLDITTDEDLEKVLDKAVATKDIEHVPYVITREMIKKAILDLEAYNLNS
ncbi:MAG TPA: iron-containing alcohol dehydrogenase family protein [Candidatus Avacidaminococcus intestinavium]|uniref:Glycerol dehydrogenase n=1 Tax=Candidatus Avacidaminococcus intestinavium TaxID=2840684 RepID=A0A9D1MQA6_9FIRM|nr:iron-containing alcohol dehydrogenase family protein [Candidatus Avacidaminococcus intestinavium]